MKKLMMLASLFLLSYPCSTHAMRPQITEELKAINQEMENLQLLMTFGTYMDQEVAKLIPALAARTPTPAPATTSSDDPTPRLIDAINGNFSQLATDCSNYNIDPEKKYHHRLVGHAGNFATRIQAIFPCIVAASTSQAMTLTDADKTILKILQPMDLVLKAYIQNMNAHVTEFGNPATLGIRYQSLVFFRTAKQMEIANLDIAENINLETTKATLAANLQQWKDLLDQGMLEILDDNKKTTVITHIATITTQTWAFVTEADPAQRDSNFITDIINFNRDFGSLIQQMAIRQN